jgi:hypothetical protein
MKYILYNVSFLQIILPTKEEYKLGDKADRVVRSVHLRKGNNRQEAALTGFNLPLIGSIKLYYR